MKRIRPFTWYMLGLNVVSAIVYSRLGLHLCAMGFSLMTGLYLADAVDEGMGKR